MDERERSPRQVVLNKAYFHRLSIAQLLKLMNIILEELLQRLHVSVNMVDPMEVRTSAPDPGPDNPILPALLLFRLLLLLALHSPESSSATCIFSSMA